jgi:hypothetical protein
MNDIDDPLDMFFNFIEKKGWIWTGKEIGGAVGFFCSLGWEFQFLVLISGIPIRSTIPILFQIPNILVGFLLQFHC